MIWLSLLVLIALSAAAWFGGRAVARRRAVGVRSHSRPGQHGAYALIWVAAPALLALVLAAAFSGGVESRLIRAGAPESVAQLEPFRRQAFFADARLVGQGRPLREIAVLFRTNGQSEAFESALADADVP